MAGSEIEVPKELREFMPSGAQETVLGHRNGAKKQYRYGNLHIREYDDKFLVHTDKFDPRKDIVGHLLHDAPEVLIGLACAALGGMQASKQTRKIPPRVLSLIITGYLGYATARKLKDHLEGQDDNS